MRKVGSLTRLEVPNTAVRRITRGGEDGHHAGITQFASYVEFNNPDSPSPKGSAGYEHLDEYHAVDPATAIDQVATLVPDSKGWDCTGRDPHLFLVENVYHH